VIETRHTVIIEPVAAGWSVQVVGADNPMMFANAYAAERAGRDLALRLADAGSEVKLELRLRGGAVVGKLMCFPRRDREDISPMRAMPPISLRAAPGR
jgi:hypothetical protein